MFEFVSYLLPRTYEAGSIGLVVGYDEDIEVRFKRFLSSPLPLTNSSE
jgi:hypothetical protein